MSTAAIRQLRLALEKSGLENWPYGLIEVPVAVKVAINSLNSQDPGFWDKGAENLYELLQQVNNQEIADIFREKTPIELAYTIRLARMSQ